MEVLAGRIKWLREKKRLGQKEVAASIGVTLSGYQKMEYDQANPKIDTLIKIADLFNVSTDFLLGRNNITDELKDIVRDIETKEIQIDKIRYEVMDFIMEINELREQMINIAEKKGFSHPDTIEISKMLDVRLTGKKVYDRNLDELKERLTKLLYTYITSVMVIPYFNITDDKIIKKYNPKFVVQNNLFDEYNLEVHVEDYGYIGTYNMFKSEDEADVTREEFTRKLEGL